ncbi:Permease of the drug/metabolite transporter (DMT) superfamily [Caldanaerovirga acetigignens]|uniref:Permease of the drug/metabolite transporter (DMT) superfamily n=1 Tax=Caldanaerovirga acetigignens TaxID=447595 RepID=A0A1M7IUY5_9FIRM|nr:EamA family transporter [Caldanaerovirga acetigignens]SHM44551.1 Permease of the drug/metabolite transporter (DMT) superfamily [Caldanaerovirga acetigignens]
MKAERIKAYLAGVGYSTIFGFSFLFTKNALDKVDPLRFIGFRFAVAALAVTTLASLGIVPVSFKGKSFKPLLFVSLLEPVCYFIFETLGVKHTTASQAGLMIALIPIFVAVLGALILNEKLSVPQIFFTVLSVAGVMVIASSQGASDVAGSKIGLVLLLGAVISAAFFNIFSRKFSSNYSPFEITFAMMWVGAIFFNGAAFILFMRSGKVADYFSPFFDPQVIFALLYLGLLSSVVAFFLVNFTLSRLPASRSAVFSNLTTVISVLAGVVFRREPFTLTHAAGALMILLGVWGTNRFSPEGEKSPRNSGAAC